MLALSSMAPTVIAESAAPTDVTLLYPSLPIAATQTIPASEAAFTAFASAPVPLSPGSSPVGLELLPNDIESMSIPLLESLFPQSVLTF